MRLETVAVLAAALVSPRATDACTTFAIPNTSERVVGKNYDFRFGDGLAFVNKRRVAKQAFLLSAGRPARWVSRFGSITFNQFGRDLPMGGMNERGLVVEIMWLEDARYPTEKDPRPALNELQWIQYMLDTAATVEEALANAEKVRIAKAYAPVHYLACDATGACATFEFLDGKLVSHSDDSLPVPALTNTPYAKSLRFLRRHRGFGGEQRLSRNLTSLGRFVHVAALAKSYEAAKDGSAVRFAFEIADSVRNPGNTQWQIVYETASGRAHFRNAGEDAHTTLELASLDFGCETPVKIFDLRGTATGDKTRTFRDYSPDINRRSIEIGLRALGLKLSTEAVEGLARHPEVATRCQAKERPAGGERREP